VNLKLLQTERMSDRLRSAAIRPSERQLLITDFRGSKQEKDFTEPTNCDGLGRIRHFRRRARSEWPTNPLPIDPASRALNLEKGETLRAQVFQNAVCNWRCWYCFVDFKLLAASRKHSRWVTTDELVELFLSEPVRPTMIDLTGGQPDLTPEWVPWMMQSLRNKGLDKTIYLWSDDNLSNDFFWRFLSDDQRQQISDYPMYGRVCCFKGITPEAFSFNTMAEPELFYQQFYLFERLLSVPIDLYAYVTLTTPIREGIERHVSDFIDRLQKIDVNLPLRTVPLEIGVFTPVAPRLNDDRMIALANQHEAIRVWNKELEARFPAADRALPVEEVCWRSRPAS